MKSKTNPDTGVRKVALETVDRNKLAAANDVLTELSWQLQGAEPGHKVLALSAEIVALLEDPRLKPAGDETKKPA